MDLFPEVSLVPEGTEGVSRSPHRVFHHSLVDADSDLRNHSENGISDNLLGQIQDDAVIVDVTVLIGLPDKVETAAVGSGGSS